MFNNLKCLIIGYGSIGKRHAKLLSKICGKNSVFILSQKRIKDYKSFKNLKDIIKNNFDYIIICSPPSKHYSQIKFIDRNFKNKIILVEKPLFNKSKNLMIKNNKFFIGYNLRFNPLIDIIKKKIKGKKIFSAIINCSSFLPDWRKNTDYRNVYSSKKNMGGGVLLDLSHELDYFQFIFGKLKIGNINFTKINKLSNLEINVEDNALILGRVKKMDFIINFNFYSKYINREIILETFNETIKVDLINCVMEISSKNGKSFKKIKIKPVDTYFEQHLNILNNKSIKKACSWREGSNIIDLIDKIKKLKRNVRKKNK